MRFIQWMIGVAVVAVAGAGLIWLFSSGDAARLRRENEELARRHLELQRAIDRLTGEERVGEVYVVDQVKPGEMLNGRSADQCVTTIEFIELDREQHPLPSQRFVIADNVIFFDALVLQFDSEHVAAGDPLRGKSLALFRRIYGEHQKPADGFPIDPAGDVPNIFRVNPEPNEFERGLWARFWDYAADPDLAKRDGVRVAEGVAVYEPMERGQVWTLTLQNNGGLNIKLRRRGAEASTGPGPTPPAGDESAAPAPAAGEGGSDSSN